MFGVSVSKFLNHDQKKKLAKPSSKVSKWSIGTVKKVLQLHFSRGLTGYNMLLKQHFPLPSVRSLQRSLHHAKFESGVVGEVQKSSNIVAVHKVILTKISIWG